MSAAGNEMAADSYTGQKRADTLLIQLPRRRIIRAIMRRFVRFALSLLTRSHIQGMENFPEDGPVIVVGNHTGAMEVVMMAVHARRPVEFMAAVEMPWRGWMGRVIDLYGIIPVYRGSTGTRSMKMGLQVLQQGGYLGIFPEGGIGEPGVDQTKTGVAWLSHISQTPVLPIGFGDTRGKLSELLRFRRPDLNMKVGTLLPPVQLDPSQRRESLQKATDRIMDAVWELVPEAERQRRHEHPKNEKFTFSLRVLDRTGAEIAPVLRMDDSSWISRFIHRPNLIDSIRDYILLPVQVLKELHLRPDARDLHKAVSSVIDYVNSENPHYFTYRYGRDMGAAFMTSFQQLRDLLQWVMDNGYSVVAEAAYEYVDEGTGQVHVLTVPEEVHQW